MKLEILVEAPEETRCLTAGELNQVTDYRIGRTFKRELSIEEEALVAEMRASSSFDVEAALASLWPTFPKWENPQPEPVHPLASVINRHYLGG